MEKRIINGIRKSSYTEMTQSYRDMHTFAMRFNKYMNKPRDYLIEFGVSATDANILGLIYDEPGITPTQLADIWGSTSGAISQVLKRLEEKGFITRNKEDGNSKTVHLYTTDTGSSLSEAHYAYNNARAAKNAQTALKDCTKEEIEIFFKLLKIYNEIYK